MLVVPLTISPLSNSVAFAQLPFQYKPSLSLSQCKTLGGLLPVVSAIARYVKPPTLTTSPCLYAVTAL